MCLCDLNRCKVRQLWKVAQGHGLCPALHKALHKGLESESVAAPELVVSVCRCCQAECLSLRPPRSEPTEAGEHLLLHFRGGPGFLEKKMHFETGGNMPDLETMPEISPVCVTLMSQGPFVS